MRSLLAIALALLGLGCIPVPTVLLRDASVLPAGHATMRHAGGAEWYSATMLNDDNYDPEGVLPYYSRVLVHGVGCRSDLTAGFANTQGFVGARYQMIGAPGESIGFAMSLEAGGSAIVGAARLLELAEVHLGANMSYGMRERSLYLSYRGHWVTAFPPDDASPSDDFEQHAVFLGMSMHGPTNRRNPVGVEIFHTWPGDRRETRHSVIDTWGLNLCFPLR